jgi:hypothetical protein
VDALPTTVDHADFQRTVYKKTLPTGAKHGALYLNRSPKDREELNGADANKGTGVTDVPRNRCVVRSSRCSTRLSASRGEMVLTTCMGARHGAVEADRADVESVTAAILAKAKATSGCRNCS